MNISIGELSRRTGVKVPTIRYYEGAGLMPAPTRTEGKQRRYLETEISRLNFIRHARELGFEIRRFASCWLCPPSRTGPARRWTASPVDTWPRSSVESGNSWLCAESCGAWSRHVATVGWGVSGDRDAGRPSTVRA